MKISKRMNIPRDFSPIEIDINDPKKFADVVFLVDREDFINDLIALRKKWLTKKYGFKDGKLLLRNGSKHWFTFPWQWKKLPSTQGERLMKLDGLLHNLSYVDKLDLGEREKLLSEYKKLLRLQPIEDFRFDVSDLRKKYKRPFNFDNIISCAIIYGEVNEEDYIPCEIKKEYPEVEFLPYFEDAEITIRISPLAKLKDIQKLLGGDLFQKIRKDYVDKELGGNLLLIEKKKSFKKHREWFWLFQKDRLSPEKICSIEKENFEKKQKDAVLISKSGVEKAIKRYMGLLSLKITA